MSTRNSHYDVIIAGSCCVGAATAMLLARRGARVLVLDRAADEIGGYLLELNAAMSEEMAAMTHGHWGMAARRPDPRPRPALTPMDVSLVFKEQHQFHIHAGRGELTAGAV
jgi:glycine/D-amino acid oxidase-like deaminating enzyme